MFDAGQVRATLGADFRPGGFLAFDGAMKRSGKHVNGFEAALLRSSQRGSTALRTLGTAAGLGAGGGIVALGIAIAGTVKTAANFESQLSSLKAVTQANGKQMAMMRKQAMDAGAATKYSALQAAQAQTELAKGGMSVANIMGGGLNGALALAAAGDLDLAEAAKYTANALNLFKLKGAQATHVADALAQAANSTTADVSDFGMALTQGGSAAKQAGLSFDQTMVILESLANAGIKNSDAGTSMKVALLQLIAPTKKAAAVMAEKHINFVKANGSMRSAAQISDQLRKATKGMGDAQRVALFKTLAGTDGFRVLGALYDDGSHKLQRYSRQLALQGQAAKVAAEKQNNLKGHIENLRGSIETAAIAVGTKFLPMLDEGAKSLTTMINNASANGDMDKFANSMVDAAHGALEFGQALADIGSKAMAAGAPVAHVLGTITRAVASLPAGVQAGALTGLISGFIGLRVAGAAAPGIRAVATAITAANAAAAGASFTNAAMMPGSGPMGAGLLKSQSAAKAGFKSLAVSAAGAVTGVGAVTAVAVLAGVGLGMYASHQRAVAQAAKDAQASIAASNEEMKHSGDVARDAAMEVLNAEQQKAQLRGLKSQRKDAVKSGDKNAVRDIDRAIAQGKLQIEQTAANVRNKLGDIKPTAIEQAAHAHKAVAAALKLRKTSTEAVTSAEWKLDFARKYGNPKEIADAEDRLGRARSNNANNIAKYEAAQRRDTLAKAQASLASLDYQRAEKGLPAVAGRNAVAVQHLMDIVKKLPKKQRTQIEMADEGAIGKLAALAAKIKSVPDRKKLQAILSGDGTVRSKLAAVKALLDSLHDKHINVTTTTTTDSKGNKHTRVHTPTASGAKAGTARRALVGEGGGPEWIVDRRTGAARRVNGPSIVNLSDDDYVIPTENRYGGRAWDLLSMLAADLPQHKRGRKPKSKAGAAKKKKSRFKPKKRDPLALPVDEIESAYNSATSAVQREEGKGKKTNKSKLAKLKATAKQRRQELVDAKRYAAKIKAQEDEIEIARNEMDLADRHDDDGAYAAAKSKRSGALKELDRLLRGAQKKVRKNSPYWRELQKALGQNANETFDNAADTIGDAGDLTAAEQKSIDDTDASIALAELTTNTIDDDRTALTSMQQLREQILGRLQTSGAPSTAIADAAREVKSAREALANLTTNDAPDLQAQIEQANERARVAQKAADLNAAAVSAFGGPGDIGSGGANAFGAAGGITVNQTNNMMHPSDPRVLDTIGRTTVAGFAQQGSRKSSKYPTGV